MTKTLQKVRVIARNASHTSATHYQLLPSGCTFRLAKVSTVRVARNFVPQYVYCLLTLQTFTQKWRKPQAGTTEA